MKSSFLKYTYSFVFAVVAMLTSCSESDVLLAEDDNDTNVTFSLTADDVETRAAVDMRYVMAIYDETETNVVVAETEFTSSTFSVRLDPGKYTCLFWADFGSENYDATNLNDVELSDDATNAEAFFAKQGITVTDGSTVNVSLHRAVAQVILRETATLLKGTMTVGYNKYQNFNVSTGIASNESSVTKTLNMPSDVFGSAAEPAEVCSIFLLANSEEYLTDFKVKYNDEKEKTISNVPIQANCKTNLNGNYGNIPYVTFSSASEQKFGMFFLDYRFGTDESLEYAVGDGEWTKITNTIRDIAFGGTLGDLRLRGKCHTGTAISDTQYCQVFFSNANMPIECTGDIRTLIDYSDYANASTADAAFCRLFAGCGTLTRTPVLPSTTLSSECYMYMFAGCTSLTQAPVLPANTLADSCYLGMFADCTSLTQAPRLPATTLAEGCYYQMFANCTSLTQAPELPASELVRYCYYEIFSGCTSLSSVTMLATNVGAEGCLEDWLKNAGTEASMRTLTLANQEIYNTISANQSYLPDTWKQGATGTTVIFKE